MAFLLVFFAVQVVTSGSEEIGWRGYLTHKLLPGRGWWDTGWAVGLVWAAWHYPVAIQMFVAQGMVYLQVLGSLAGFSIGIVAMSILQAWFYQRTQSVAVSVLIHAAFNTVPLTHGAAVRRISRSRVRQPAAVGSCHRAQIQQRPRRQVRNQ